MVLSVPNDDVIVTLLQVPSTTGAPLLAGIEPDVNAPALAMKVPAIEERETASLSDIANITPANFAPLLAGSFARLLGAWRMTEASSLAAAWEQRAHPKGTALSVHVGPDEKVDGTFDGLDADGAMRLRRDDGSIALVRVGDVFLG